MNIVSIVLRCLLFPLLLAVACTTVVSGGSGTETTTGILGSVINDQGYPQPLVQVQLLPASFDPVLDDTTIPVDTTDSLGRYRFTAVDSGEYTVQMVHLTCGTRALISGIHTALDTVSLASVTLRAPGAMKISLPDGINRSTGYVYIPGTTFFTFLKVGPGFVIIDSLPAQRIPEIVYSSTNQMTTFTMRYNIAIVSGDTVDILNPSWKYARKIVFNTSPSGADVASDVADFPVLIRLHAGNFDFSQAQSGGSDMRLTKMDTTPLPYEIERWDATSRHAEIWVRMDTVYGNDTAQSIMIYWGNIAATDASSGASVFDTADGFQGVWHLAEAGNTTAKDATINHFNGTPMGMSAASAVDGIIGGAQLFDGVASCYTIANTAASTLNFPVNGPFTISTWINIDTLDSALHTIVSKGNRQYSLGTVISNEWEFSVCPASGGWDITNSSATPKAWTHLVGVRNGAFQYLYVNGICIDSTATNRFSGITRYTGDDLNIGKCPNDSLYFFNGIIDEVAVSGVVRDPAWIKLSYMNQKMNDKLVTFR
jgi:hypothetical protein